MCSGSVILAAAGLLEGKRATSHWMVVPMLKTFGVTPVSDERIVHEGDIVTSAGVSAGIDLAMWLAGQISGEARAKAVQLVIEYDPQPPFDSGHMSKASAATKATATALLSKETVKHGQLPRRCCCSGTRRCAPPARAAAANVAISACLVALTATDHAEIARSSVVGVNLAYDDRGRGDPVLFIAGRGGAGRTWHLHQVPAFLTAGYRAITFDNRGIGATESADGFGTEQMVADTAALIEKLDVAPVRIVAVSMGSFIAQELMLARPELVRSAVLMATRGRHDHTRDFFRSAERELAESGMQLPASYDAKVRLLESFSPKTLNDERAVRDWIDMFTMWPIKPTPGLRCQLDVGPRATGCRLTEALRPRRWSSGSPTTWCCRRTWAARSPTPSRTAATWRYPTPGIWASSKSRRSSTRRC